jgi:hypothetical protein
VQIHRWVPLWASAFIAFAFLFFAAEVFVLRGSPVPERSYGRVLGGAFLGAAVAAACAYFWPRA